MGADDTRRRRLEELLDLAQAYRRWNRRQLAEALGRDPSNLVPASGSPKIDLVVELAQALDWPIENVVRSFWLDEPTMGRQRNQHVAADFDELECESKRACREGRSTDAVELARGAASVARDSEQRAIACIREAAGWDGLGRYVDALKASNRGLAEPEVSIDRRLVLQVNLANEYYTLWHAIEARAMAHELVQHYESDPPRNRMNEVSSAFSFYVRGNSSRRLMAIDRPREQEHAQRAREDLVTAERRFDDLATRYEEEAYRGIANTCHGGILETEVAIGERRADCVVNEISSRLDAIVDPEDCPCGDWLESYGWWCIYGCNVALRHLDDERSIQQHLAVFTNKADEIAERTSNWAMRERIVTMEYARRRRFVDWTGMDPDWTMDADDVRAIAGTMGRFPRFHDVGWNVLRSARIVRDTERNGSPRRIAAAR